MTLAATVSPSAAIDPNTNLVPGQSYTFTFNAFDLNPFVQPSDLQTDLVNGVGYISNVYVNQGVGPYYVQFTYEGDGHDAVNGLAYDMEQAVNNNHTAWSWTFAAALIGPQSPGTIQQGAADAGTAAKNAGLSLPDTSTLVIIVIGIALIVFVMSGGPGIVRAASGE